LSEASPCDMTSSPMVSLVRAVGPVGCGELASGRLTTAVFKPAQFRAERLALRQRQSVMQSDHWLDEHLSFAGRE
jgi:hypothetical protein